jgi:hypothetical protein
MWIHIMGAYALMSQSAFPGMRAASFCPLDSIVIGRTREVDTVEDKNVPRQEIDFEKKKPLMGKPGRRCVRKFFDGRAWRPIRSGEVPNVRLLSLRKSFSPYLIKTN